MIFSFGHVDRFVVSGFPSSSDVAAISATRGQSKTAATDLGNCARFFFGTFSRPKTATVHRIEDEDRTTETRNFRRNSADALASRAKTGQGRIIPLGKPFAALFSALLPRPLRPLRPPARNALCIIQFPPEFRSRAAPAGTPLKYSAFGARPCKTRARPPRTRGRLRRYQLSTANEKRPLTHRSCDKRNPWPTFGDVVNWRLSEETNE